MTERREGYTVLCEEVAVIKEVVGRLEKSLLGNGRQGKLADLDDDISKLDERLEHLEGWRKWINGVTAAVTAILSAAVTWLGLKH